MQKTKKSFISNYVDIDSQVYSIPKYCKQKKKTATFISHMWGQNDIETQ